MHRLARHVAVRRSLGTVAREQTSCRICTPALATASAPQTLPPAIRVTFPHILLQPTARSFHSGPAPQRDSSKHNKPPETPPPTDFGELDVLGNTPPPSTSVDVCMYDGFGLNSGMTITNGDGALLVGGEAFSWRPWEAKGGELRLANKKGQFELPAEALSMFDMLWPRPDLLIIGVGRSNMPLSPATRQSIADMGIRIEVLDTRNAAAQFNLLATERGVGDVAAALIPIGWQEGVGAK